MTLEQGQALKEAIIVVLHQLQMKKGVELGPLG